VVRISMFGFYSHAKKVVIKDERDYYGKILQDLAEEADRIIDEENKGLLRRVPSSDEDLVDDGYDSDDWLKDAQREMEQEDEIGEYESMLMNLADDRTKRVVDNNSKMEDITAGGGFTDSLFDTLGLHLNSILVSSGDRVEEEEYDYDSDEYFEQMEDVPVEKIESDDIKTDIKSTPFLYKKTVAIKTFKFHYRKKKPSKKPKKEIKSFDRDDEFEIALNSIRNELIKAPISEESDLLEKLRRFLMRQEIIGRLSRKRKRVRQSGNLLKVILMNVVLKTVSNHFLMFKLSISEYYIFRLIVHHIVSSEVLIHVRRKLIRRLSVVTPFSCK
jgi:hypothetical protein